ncbi:N(6)-adenine-specific methyltransferase METTL4 [Onthophagus taurus]|uniref:N(6)-adenine-specific methyltransferase METTL4 n=1 Tax=Onthophagus taurus TaxID=166361 RepID=UPI0039BE32A3
MSVLYENDNAIFISHEKYIKTIYESVEKDGNVVSYQANEDLFNISHPYVNKKIVKKKGDDTKEDTKEKFQELTCSIGRIKSIYEMVKKELIERSALLVNLNDYDAKGNETALKLSDMIYRESSECDIEGIKGENQKDVAINVTLKNTEFLFPKDCKFYCSNVNVIGDKLGFDNIFDLVIIDPPWWNKYIRRKRKKSNDGYNMLYNNNLLDIPIESLIHDGSLIVVWCTNAKSNINSLKNDIFKKWGVEYFATWFWLKITKKGETICNFSEPPGKQPFEQILFAARDVTKFSSIMDGKVVVSVPSALHSHKPPLNDVLQKFLPKNPKCLEIFARYLLPNTTSYGLEAIKFQHISLYKEQSE